MIEGFVTSFMLGLLTPLSAVCTLPLYPGFLVYLANKVSSNAGRKTFISIGFVITAGVIFFMLVLGLVFTTILQTSLTNVIGIVSPLAFFILLVISILLILDFDFSRHLPHFNAPLTQGPFLNAFIFGFFFGAIIIPCNPAFIAAFFTRAFLVRNFFENIMNFLFFGAGIGFPLLVFSAVSAATGREIINLLTRHKRIINLVSGFIMLAVSTYYLLFFLRVLG